jgi:hypothetical protein
MQGGGGAGASEDQCRHRVARASACCATLPLSLFSAGTCNPVTAHQHHSLASKRKDDYVHLAGFVGHLSDHVAGGDILPPATDCLPYRLLCAQNHFKSWLRTTSPLARSFYNSTTLRRKATLAKGVANQGRANSSYVLVAIDLLPLLDSLGCVS